MTGHLTKQAIDALAAKARSLGGKQLAPVDDREPGLRIRISLGTWPGMSIADARRAAQDKRRQIDGGIDPNQERRDAVRKAEQAMTLGQALQRYEIEHLLQNRRGAATRRAIDGKRGLLRDFGDRDISSITRSDILSAVRRHAAEAPIAANRCLAYSNAFFNWCVAQDILETSPSATIKKPSKERQRDRFHSVDELREIWNEAGTMGYPFGPLYQLLVVLPMRREELAALPIAEIEAGDGGLCNGGVWTLPSARTKRANALRVPLSKLAGSIIADAIADPLRPKDSPYVFTTTGETPVSGFTKAKKRLDAAIERARQEKPFAESEKSMPHWVMHDLRTTFNTLACDILHADMAVVDRILNHVASATTSKVMRVYNRSELFEPRKQVLEQWADLIMDIVKT
jgi:integrase